MHLQWLLGHKAVVQLTKECWCSALAVLASGSGVSTERETFMDLVKTEITRLNGEVANRGSMSMVFHSGGVHVSLASTCSPLALACSTLHQFLRVISRVYRQHIERTACKQLG